MVRHIHSESWGNDKRCSDVMAAAEEAHKSRENPAWCLRCAFVSKSPKRTATALSHEAGHESSLKVARWIAPSTLAQSKERKGSNFAA